MIDEIVKSGELNGYIVGELVETNDSAHVLHAENPGLDLPVTVHVRRKDYCSEQFKKIAHTSARLSSHINIRTIHGGSFAGDEKDHVVVARCEDRLSDLLGELVTPLSEDEIYNVLSGDDLDMLTEKEISEILPAEKKLDSLFTLESCSQILGALDYAHRNGVYHGALSSKNVFYRDGQVNVGGFTGRGSLEGISNAEMYDVCSVGLVLGEMFAGLKPEERLEWLEQIALDSASGKYSSVAEMRDELDRRLVENYSESVEEKTESFFERGARLAREISGLIRYLGKSKE